MNNNGVALFGYRLFELNGIMSLIYLYELIPMSWFEGVGSLEYVVSKVLNSLIFVSTLMGLVCRKKI